MRYFIGFLLCLCLVACRKKNEALPIEEEKLVSLLSDIHIAEAAMQNLAKTVKDSMAAIYYDQIYKIHDTDKETLNKTIVLLREQPGRLSRIYSKVLEELNQKDATQPKGAERSN